MRVNSRLLLLTLLLVFSSVIVTNTNHAVARENQRPINLDQGISLQAFVPSAPLIITSNAELATAASSGDGSALTPWVIEGWNITSSASVLISIFGTTDYFIIRNNFLNGLTRVNTGVYTDNVNNGWIFNNTILNNDVGILLWNGIDIVVAENTVSNSSLDSGLIEIRYGSDIVIANNSLTMTDYGNGIYLDNAQRVIVEDNDIVNMDSKLAIYTTSTTGDISILNNTITNVIVASNAYHGISLAGNNNVVRDNVITGGNYGLRVMTTSDGNIIAGNTFLGQTVRTLDIFTSDNNVISNNEIRDGNTGINLDGLSAMLNNTISNNQINNTGSGIRIITSISNVTISGNTIAYSSTGLYISTGFPFGNSFKITDNTITGSLAYGIRIYNMNDSLITRNTLVDNGDAGLKIDGDLSNSTISFNTIENNGRDGIYLQSSTNNKVVNNSISNNKNDGITLVSISTDNLIANNSIVRNSRGIVIQNNADDNIIKHNLIFRHSFQGLYIISNGNNATLNDFVANNLGSSSQARMDDILNRVEGNFWADWVSPDSDNNQIVDIPYQFEFFGNDSSPRAVPVAILDFDPFSPFLDSPDDIVMQLRATGFTLYWEGTASEATTFTAFNNSIAFDSGTFVIGQSIQIPVVAPPVGIHNFTLVLTDTSGRTAADSIIVEITQETGPPNIISGPTDTSLITGEIKNIGWLATDLQPGIYELYNDGILYNSSTWYSGVVVTFKLSDLLPGVYNFTIVFYDVNGLSDSHEITITVNPDIDPPTLSFQGTYSMDEGTIGNSVDWWASDINLQNYVIYKDNVILSAGTYNTSYDGVTVSLDGLSNGVYNFTLTATDVWGNSASGTTIVTILADTTPPLITVRPEGYIGFSEGATEFQLEYQAQDANPDIYTITKDGVQVATGSWQSDVSVIYSLSGLVAGSYIFVITFFDENGQSTSYETTVDVTAQQTDDPGTTSDTPLDTFSSNPPPKDDSEGFLSLSTNLFIFSIAFIVLVRRKIRK